MVRPSFTPAQLRAFADRPWGEVRRAKEDYWTQLWRQQTPTERLAMASAQWEHARTVNPAVSGEASRRADLDHHVRLADRIRRVADVFADR